MLQNHNHQGKINSCLEVRLPPLYNGLRYVKNSIMFPGQTKTKGEQKNHKDFHGIIISIIMAILERRNRKNEKIYIGLMS